MAAIGAVSTFFQEYAFRSRISFRDEFVRRSSFSTCTGLLVVVRHNFGPFTADVEANLLCEEI